MKKKYLVFISIAILLCVLVTIFVQNTNFKERYLAGEKVVDGLYLYNLDIGDNYHDIKIINDNIYYFVDLSDKYEIYKVDIYNNKTEKVGVIELKDYYCYVDKDYIICSSEKNEIIYNFKLEKLYDGESNKIIPYKNNYIKVIDNVIYYKDKEYGRIKSSANSYNVYNYDVFDDNVYLYFGNYDGESCIYNFKEDKCEEYDYNGIKKYSNGLYFFDNNKISVTNLDNNEIKEYNNPVKAYLSQSQLNDNLLYYFSNDYLRIYNLENNKVNLYDYRINKFINEIVLNKNLLYLMSYDEVYIIKLDEISTNEMTVDELEIEFENKISNKIDNIKNEYNVEIKIREEANLNFDFWNQSTKGEDIYDNINDSLYYAEEVLGMFGKEFFEEFIHNDYTGVRIYLVSQITSDDFSRSGEAFRYYDKYAIIAQSYDFKRTLCHELMHTLEDAVFVKGNDMFNKWDSYNPKDFKYIQEYNSFDSPYKYTVDYKEGNVYFVDNYSQMNELEDRARIFENLCMNTASNIIDNQYLLKKAEYQVEEINKYYPMLENSIIFNSLNNN